MVGIEVASGKVVIRGLGEGEVERRGGRRRS